MPNIQDDKRMFDMVIKNPDAPEVQLFKQVLGLGDDEIRAGTLAKKLESENPDDPNIAMLRNSVFNKIANTRPAEEGFATAGGGIINRFVAKNIIDQDPNVQAQYYSRRGFDTRFTKGNLEVKRPDATNFDAVDPKGIDLFDAFDVVGDLIEGAATTAVAGTVGAFVLPSGIAPAATAAALAGGATTGLFEAGRQTAGRLLGARGERDPGQVGVATLIGAGAPAALKGAGALFKGSGKLIGKGLVKAQGGLKPNADAVKAAAKEIGATPTPGQLFDSRIVGELESAQFQSAGLIGGTGTRKLIDANQKAAQETAETLVKSASNRTKFDVGDDVGKTLVNDLTEKLKPAEAIYQKLESTFKRKAYKPDLSKLNETFETLKKDLKFDEKGMALVNGLKEQSKNIKNLDDLKKFRTALANELGRDPLNKSNSAIIGRLYGPLTDARSDTLLALAKRFSPKKKDIEIFSIDELPKGVKIGKQHTPMQDIGEEVGVNYRLDGLEDVFYAVKNGKVVGHIGLDGDGSVKTVFVDKLHRRNKIAENFYEEIADRYGSIKSDDLDAMEPEAKSLWIKLSKKHKSKVTGGKSGEPFKLDAPKIAKAEGGDFFDAAKKDIEMADAIYKKSAKELENVILSPGKKLKGSPKKELAKFLESTPEIDRINKILKTNDPKKIAGVQKAFPKAFEELRTIKIAEIAEKASNGGVVNPLQLAKKINALPPETVKLIFGPNAQKKADALQIFLQNVPAKAGPSGTPRGMEVFRFRFILDNLQSLRRDFTLGVRTKAGMDKGIFNFIGRSLASPRTQTIAVATKRGQQKDDVAPPLLPPRAKRQPLLIPQR